MRVKCINDIGNWLLTKGEIYEVVEETNLFYWIKLVFCNNNMYFSKKRFEIVEE